jgi:hypothetical protein
MRQLLAAVVVVAASALTGCSRLPPVPAPVNNETPSCSQHGL